ncbi:MAG: hypothetical protein ABSH48_14400 [Verrucomicrobiota bacterium]|jgi:hypothetical protein
MIHIATAHWNTDRWIAPQHSYLCQHLKSDFRVYAWLNNIPRAPTDSFYYCCSEPVGPHAVKLNILADIVQASAEGPDDILIFLDGDAFPIADLEPVITRKLSTHPLTAVQRLENNGDCQPHPCFCATTVGFWKEIKGDWKEGHRWKNNDGQDVTDVGGNLLKQLADRGTDWAPLLRSNRVNLHPLYFGLYGGVIYHHGAGFREAVCRLDEKQAALSSRDKLWSRVVPGYRRLARRRALERLKSQNGDLSELVFERILKDPNFHAHF